MGYKITRFSDTMDYLDHDRTKAMTATKLLYYFVYSHRSKGLNIAWFWP